MKIDYAKVSQSTQSYMHIANEESKFMRVHTRRDFE